MGLLAFSFLFISQFKSPPRLFRISQQNLRLQDRDPSCCAFQVLQLIDRKIRSRRSGMGALSRHLNHPQNLVLVAQDLGAALGI